MTITEFLLARIAEDEAVAREVIEANKTDPVASEHDPECTTWATDGNFGQLAAYIDPQRLLAECAAKRAIVEQYIEAESSAKAYRSSAAYDPADMNDQVKIELKKAEARLGQMEIVIRYLVKIYADHPDFKDEWRIG